ncbi:hypothetical protein [Paenibacillus wenxiniae]|uniref:SurA N-terminal domain-containing protein n=1 Tax=Paenibacillus wenxiniae TaxID=1636843 RepID=A0ABW4RPQ7_9BACL
MNKKVIVTALGMIIVTAAGVAVAQYGGAQPSKEQVAAKQQAVVQTTFDQLQSADGQQGSASGSSADSPNNGLLVTGDDIRISKQEFDFYKANVEMVTKLNQLQQGEQVAGNMATDSSQLLNQLLKTELAVQYAKKIGITVSEQEMTQMVNTEKTRLYDATLASEHNDQQLIQQIMAHRIQLTGLSEQEFWKSEPIKQQYGKTIYMSKLYDELLKKGQIDGPAAFDAFQDKLVQEQQGQYTIHTQLLNKS